MAIFPAGIRTFIKTSSHDWNDPGLSCCLADTWYHITLTWDGETLLTYINGTGMSRQNAKSRPLYTPNGYDDFMIGRPNNMAEYFGQFTIDEMYVWRKAISETDIKIIFKAHFQSKCHANESRTTVTWAKEIKYSATPKALTLVYGDQI